MNNIFADTIKKLLPQIDGTPTPNKGSRDEKIARGFQKMEAFFERGMKLNPVRDSYQKDRSRVFRYPNHDPKVKRPGKAFFRCGDLGYFNPGKAVPYSRAEVRRRGLK